MILSFCFIDRDSWIFLDNTPLVSMSCSLSENSYLSYYVQTDFRGYLKNGITGAGRVGGTQKKWQKVVDEYLHLFNTQIHIR